jgi:hypothetical protein
LSLELRLTRWCHLHKRHQGLVLSQWRLLSLQQASALRVKLSLTLLLCHAANAL